MTIHTRRRTRLKILGNQQTVRYILLLLFCFLNLFLFIESHLQKTCYMYIIIDCSHTFVRISYYHRPQGAQHNARFSILSTFYYRYYYYIFYNSEYYQPQHRLDNIIACHMTMYTYVIRINALYIIILNDICVLIHPRGFQLKMQS